MTAGRGNLFDEGPTACPFLALDRDRERRGDEPDPRHRCYATPTPEPRALAHQRAFCLTPNFPTCPIFQDWALRAAARPVPLRAQPMVLPPDDDAPVGEPAPLVLDEPAAATGESAVPEQVSLFDTPIVPAPEAAISLDEEPPPRPPVASSPGPAGATPFGGPLSSEPMIPPPIRPSRPAPTTSGGPAAEPTPARTRGKTTLRREDIVPSWERSRYDLPGTERRRRGGGGDFWSRLAFVFTALAILSLAALIVLLLPILLGARPGASSTPTQIAASSSPTVSPSPSPTPGPTWMTYTIKLGDSLFAIAAEFAITYEQLIAANPQITNPNFIRAGDVINIPPPDFVPPSPSRGPSSAPSPSATATG